MPISLCTDHLGEANLKGIFVWQAREGSEEEFVRRWRHDSELIQKSAGALGTLLHRSQTERGRFLGFASWESASDRAKAMAELEAARVPFRTAEEISEIVFVGFFKEPEDFVPPATSVQ